MDCKCNDYIALLKLEKRGLKTLFWSVKEYSKNKKKKYLLSSYKNRKITYRYRKVLLNSEIDHFLDFTAKKLSIGTIKPFRTRRFLEFSFFLDMPVFEQKFKELIDVSFFQLKLIYGNLISLLQIVNSIERRFALYRIQVWYSVFLNRSQNFFNYQPFFHKMRVNFDNVFLAFYFNLLKHKYCHLPLKVGESETLFFLSRFNQSNWLSIKLNALFFLKKIMHLIVRLPPYKDMKYIFTIMNNNMQTVYHFHLVEFYFRAERYLKLLFFGVFSGRFKELMFYPLKFNSYYDSVEEFDEREEAGDKRRRHSYGLINQKEVDEKEMAELNLKLISTFLYGRKR